MAVDSHSFFADPDPAIFLNADPNPADKTKRIRIQLHKFGTNNLMKRECPGVVKNTKDCSKV